jgi:hypothetical protein
MGEPEKGYSNSGGQTKMNPTSVFRLRRCRERIPELAEDKLRCVVRAVA